LFIENKDPFLLNNAAHEAINNLNNWFIANKLTLIVDKTCYMVFSTHRKDCSEKDCSANFKLLLGGYETNKVKSCRYLGLIIDDRAY